MRAYRYGIRSILKVTKKTNISSSEKLVVLLVLGGLKGFKEEHVAFFFLIKIWFFHSMKNIFPFVNDKIRSNCKFSHFWVIKNLGLHPNSEKKPWIRIRTQWRKPHPPAWINCLNLPAHYKYVPGYRICNLGLFHRGHYKMFESILESASCHTVRTEKQKTVLYMESCNKKKVCVQTFNRNFTLQ